MKRILPPLVVLLVGLTVLVVSIVFGVSGAVSKVSELLQPAASWTAPGSASAQLSPGTWAVYEYVGVASPYGSNSGSPSRAYVDWQDITVTGPAGPVRTSCTSCGGFSQTLTLGNREYVGVASFDVVSDGEFTVDVTSGPTDMILSPSVTSVFPGALPPFLAAALGFLVMATGAIWLLVRVFSKGKRAGPPGLATPGGAELGQGAGSGVGEGAGEGEAASSVVAGTSRAALPAWYPDPNVPGQLRWWNGFTWTDRTHRLG